MYRIKYIPQRMVYQIHSRKYGAFEGNLKDITKRAMIIGLDQSELTLAYEVMNKNKHTVAEFGINGTFMYSHNKGVINE